jgi:hypothetical protein
MAYKSSITQLTGTEDSLVRGAYKIYKIYYFKSEFANVAEVNLKGMIELIEKLMIERNIFNFEMTA